MTSKNSPKPTVPQITFHKPSGQARVRIKGKDCYLGAYGSPESYEKYAELLRKVSEDVPQAQTVVILGSHATIAEVILAYLRHSETYFTDENHLPNQDAKHFRAVLKMLHGKYGRMQIAHLTGPHL